MTTPKKKPRKKTDEQHVGTEVTTETVPTPAKRKKKKTTPGMCGIVPCCLYLNFKKLLKLTLFRERNM